MDLKAFLKLAFTATPPLFHWGAKRFYEHVPPDQTEIEIPEIHRLLANLSGGGVGFSHADASTIYNLYRLSNPPDEQGKRNCELDLKGAYLGDIMKWAGPIKTPLDPNNPLLLNGIEEYYKPDGASWPLKERFTENNGPLSKVRVLGKRTQVVYDYANTLAELKAIQTIESFRTELRREVLSGHRWSGMAETASQLVAQSLPGGSYLSTTATTLKMQELAENLQRQRKAIHEFYRELKSYAKFTDQMGNNFKPATGLSSFGK